MGAASFFEAEVRSRKKDIADSPVPFMVKDLFNVELLNGTCSNENKMVFLLIWIKIVIFVL